MFVKVVEVQVVVVEIRVCVQEVVVLVVVDDAQVQLVVVVSVVCVEEFVVKVLEVIDVHGVRVEDPVLKVTVGIIGVAVVFVVIVAVGKEPAVLNVTEVTVADLEVTVTEVEVVVTDVEVDVVAVVEYGPMSYAL